MEDIKCKDCGLPPEAGHQERDDMANVYSKIAGLAKWTCFKVDPGGRRWKLEPGSVEPERDD